MEIDEYWIVDWRIKQVEIYNLDYDEEQKPQYYLWKVISEQSESLLEKNVCCGINEKILMLNDMMIAETTKKLDEHR